MSENGVEMVPKALYEMQRDYAAEMKAQLSAVTARLLAQRKRLRELERLQAEAALIDRPTRSEQSLEGAAVNGLTPVGQEAASE